MALDRATPPWSPPRLRLADEDAEPRRATWMELLYDLVFVAAVAQLADLLAHDLHHGGLWKFIGLFVPVWWAWAGQTFYANRFDTDDLAHRLLALAQMVAVAGLAASAAGALDERRVSFVLCYLALRCLLIYQYWRVRRLVPEARRLATRYLTGFSVAAGIWAVSLALPSPARYVAWAIAMAVDVGAPLSARRMQFELPPQPQHLPERFGLFIIIVLGESVASIVGGLATEDWTPAVLLAAVMSMLLALSVWWLYFDNLRESVLRRTLFAGQVWVYAHLPLAIAITAVGVALELVVGGRLGEAPPLQERWLLAGSTAAVLALLGLLHTRQLGTGRALPRLGSAAACLALGAVAGLPAIGLLLAVTALTALQVALDLSSLGRLGPAGRPGSPESQPAE